MACGRIADLRLQITNLGQAKKDVALPLRISRLLLDQSPCNRETFLIVGCRRSGVADGQLHVAGLDHANGDLPLKFQIVGIVAGEIPDYCQPLVVGGERAAGIARLRLDVADAVEGDREFAPPYPIIGVPLDKRPQDSERFLVVFQSFRGFAVTEGNGAQLVERERNIVLPLPIVAVTQSELSAPRQRRHRGVAGALHVAGGLISGRELVQQFQVEMPERGIIWGKTGQPFDKILEPLEHSAATGAFTRCGDQRFDCIPDLLQDGSDRLGTQALDVAQALRNCADVDSDGLCRRIEAVPCPLLLARG